MIFSEALAVFKSEMEDAANRAPIVALGAAARASHVAAAGALPDRIADLTAHIASHTATRLDGTVSVLDDNGLPRLVHIAGYPEMTLDQLLVETRTAHPEWFQPTAAEAVAQARVDAAKEQTALGARVRAATLARSFRPTTSSFPYGTNPFADTTINVPEQRAVLSRSAALAERMKADARAARK